MLRRDKRSSFVFWGLLGVAACGGAAPTPPVGQPPGAKREAVEVEKQTEVVVAAPEEKATEPALPTKVTSIFQFIGKDAPIIINVPRLDKVVAALDAETRETIHKEITDKLARESKFEAAVAKSMIDAFEGAVIFADPGKKGGGEKAAEEATCLAARFRDPRPMELALAAKQVERSGPRFTVKSTKDAEQGKVTAYGVWFADSAVVLGCASSEGLAKSLSVATGAAPGYASSPRFVQERANDVFVSVDMHSIVGEDFEPGSELFASVTTPGQSLGLDLRLSLYGASYPPVGSVIDAAPQALLGKMPKGTLGALGISLKRMPGKNLESVLGMIDKVSSGKKLQEAKDAAKSLGVEFADIDAALGDELAVGVYRDPKQKIDFDKSGLEHMAVVVALGTNDAAAQKKIWNALTDVVKKKKSKEITIRGDVIEAAPGPKSKNKEWARVELRKGYVVISVGDKAMVAEALRKFDKDTLAASSAFAAARAKEKPATHILGYLDGATLKALVEAKGDQAKAPAISAGPAFMSLLLGKSDRGIEMALGGGGAMELIGVGASLAVNGFKSYTAKSKASEAKMNVRFMAGYARRAYEREGDKGPRNVLCKSSLPVPATIPKGTTYKTSMAEGGDWDSGDENTGWKCLGYFSNEEIRYQYEYRQGGNYKGPKRGGPNPGKDGFEISAEGDLDADGKTSLFTRTGKIVGGKVVLDDDVFESDPSE